MRHWFFLFAAAASPLLSAEEKGYWDYHPLHVGGNGIYLGQADITPAHSDSHYGELQFNKANIFATILVPISRYSYFFPRIEWNIFTLDWNRNPKFNKTQFNYMQFGLTFYTIALEKWRWIIRGDYNMDAQHFYRPGSYGLFSGLLWGSYQIHRKWHYHIGALGYVGLQGDQFYPVLGFDYSPNKKWYFEIVFPINYEIRYQWTERWRVALKGRPLKERFRSGTHEPQARSIFSYSTMGAELNVQYEIIRKFEFEAYGGYNFGGTFYIKDLGGRNALYTDVHGSPYAGFKLDYGF